MTVSSRLTQSQRQTLSFRQIQMVNFLCLSNEGLAADLVRRAASNPFLRLHLPAAAGIAGSEEPAASDSGLYAHVMEQLRLIAAARADEALATAFVEALDDNGWLDRPLAEIAASAGRPLAAAGEMLQALQQGVEPPGLFARDLPDCLRLQALERGQYSAAMEQTLNHLPRLAEGGATAVADKTGLAPDTVAHCVAQIRRMDPRPGLAFGGSPAPLRAPDVIVSRAGSGTWQIALNRATLPVLNLLPPGGDAPQMRAVRTEAEWLASVVERRNRTVLAVARAVLTRQNGFLDHGPGALQVLSRTEIAAALGLHGSTVGRVARDLLVETPHGMRSLCSLFGGGPVRANPHGGDPIAASASAIRHRLAQIVASENPCTPLGDAALAAALAAEGKVLARRTVAKYREELGIPTRSLRRAGRI